MFYLTEIEDYVRVAPELFGLPTAEAVEKQLAESYQDYYSKEIGRVAAVVEVVAIGNGVDRKSVV